MSESECVEVGKASLPIVRSGGIWKDVGKCAVRSPEPCKPYCNGTSHEGRVSDLWWPCWRGGISQVAGFRVAGFNTRDGRRLRS